MKLVTPSYEQIQGVRDRIGRMRPGPPTAPIDVQAVRRRVVRLLHARRQR